MKKLLFQLLINAKHAMGREVQIKKNQLIAQHVKVREELELNRVSSLSKELAQHVMEQVK